MKGNCMMMMMYINICMYTLKNILYIYIYIYINDIYCECRRISNDLYYQIIFISIMIPFIIHLIL